ncbi:unnamed protein product [Diatraea saccharalis]|uniref:Uncharacterized protein n=1 Tax=Diatraea saccharalis TaxID=40085 RepID=A0A9N9QU89_9NEOP|nr:unnamed protein product [Diatraea saccharalis]
MFRQSTQTLKILIFVKIFILAVWLDCQKIDENTLCSSGNSNKCNKNLSNIINKKILIKLLVLVRRPNFRTEPVELICPKKTKLANSKNNTSMGLYKVPAEMWKSVESVGVVWLTILCNKILSSRCILNS